MQCNNENKKKFYERIFMKLNITIQHNKVNVTYDTMQREMTLVTNVT